MFRKFSSEIFSSEFFIFRNSDRNSGTFPITVGISEWKVSEMKSEGAISLRSMIDDSQPEKYKDENSFTLIESCGIFTFDASQPETDKDENSLASNESCDLFTFDASSPEKYKDAILLWFFHP